VVEPVDRGVVGGGKPHEQVLGVYGHEARKQLLEARGRILGCAASAGREVGELDAGGFEIHYALDSVRGTVGTCLLFVHRRFSGRRYSRFCAKKAATEAAALSGERRRQAVRSASHGELLLSSFRTLSTLFDRDIH